MRFQWLKLAGLFFLVWVCLAVAATFPNNENRKPEVPLIPAFQPPPTPTPRPNCPAPPYPAAAYGRNPYPTEIAPSFDQAGLNQLATAAPVLPTLVPNQAAYAPCILLKAMAYQESGWKHFEADYNNYGYTKIGPSCDYGLMQIVSGMSGGGEFDPNRTNIEIPYNMGVGTQLLIKKWNALKLSSGGFPGGPYLVGAGNPRIAEDWYYAIWAYNTWGWINNPNNNCVNWTPGCGGWFAGRPPFNPSDSSQNLLWYPYQELVWGYAAHPPTYNGVPLWQAVNLSLPTWANVGGVTEPHYPNNNLPRPTPSHTSCGLFYLPIIMKNWIPIIPCGGSTVYPAGQPYCTDRNGEVRSCNAQNANGSTGEPNNLFTNDIYYRDYPAPGVTYYYLNLPGVISGTGTIGLRYAVHSIGGSNEQHLYFEIKNADTGVWSLLGSDMYHGADPPHLRGWGFSGRISAVRVYVLWTNGQYYQPAKVDYIYVMCN